MPSLKEVKSRINSVVSTQQITKAMKMVAAAKLRRAQDNIMQMRPYAEKMNNILSNISSGIDSSMQNVYADEREVNSVIIVAITSDRGLCGAFNSSVIRMVNRLVSEDYAKQAQSGNLYVLTIGKKGNDVLSKNNKIKVVSDYTGIFGKLSFNEVRKAAEYAMNGFADKKFDKVVVVYNEFKNVATQIVRANTFLPLSSQPIQQANDNNSKNDFIFEPNKEEIVSNLLPLTLKTTFYKYVLESNASEHGARMTAMDKATENAGELLKQLRLTYNRTRQAYITKEILEIVAGAEALGGK